MHFDTLFRDQTFWNWGLNSVVAYLENRRRAIKKKAAILLGTHQREKKERRRKVVEERVSLFSASKYCSIMQIPLEDGKKQSIKSDASFPSFEFPGVPGMSVTFRDHHHHHRHLKFCFFLPISPCPTQLVNWIFPVSFSIQFRWFFLREPCLQGLALGYSFHLSPFGPLASSFLV